MAPRIQLRTLIFIYFWLLIVEGALRKWIAPQLSAPLLIIRDPLAILIYILALLRGQIPKNSYISVVNVFAVVFFVMGVVQIIMQPGLNPLVVVYGWRTYILHLPVIFIAAEVLSVDDLRRIGTWCCKIAVAMILICIGQYYAGSGGFLNAGTMADYGHTQIAFEGNHVRPSGTFSFVTGVACYFALTAAFAIWHLMSPGKKHIGRLTAYCALMSTLIYIPLSGGRLGIFMVGIVLATGGILNIGRSIANPRVWAIGIATLAGFVIASQTTGFKDVWASMQARLASARLVEDAELQRGFSTRITGGFTTPIDVIDKVPLLIGEGLGVGTQVGSVLQVGSVGDFLMGEGEWGRILGECGWFIGMGYIVFRVWLAGVLFVRALRVGWRFHYWSPLLLWSAGAWTILQGQLGQPTNLGFFVIFTAAVIIALKEAEQPASARGPTGIEMSRPPVLTVSSTGSRQGRHRHPLL